MKYQIPANVLPGAQPLLTGHYFTLLLTTIMAGPLIGMLWTGANGHFLGCRDMVRQWLIIGFGYLVMTALRVSGRWTRMNHEPETLAYLSGQIMHSLYFFVLIVVLILISDRQQVLYRLHDHGRKTWWGIPLAIVAVLLSFVIRNSFFPDMPLLQTAIGGI